MCSSCVMLSCRYWPKSQRNVSSTLVNLCYKVLRQFWRQKRVQPGTSQSVQQHQLLNSDPSALQHHNSILLFLCLLTQTTPNNICDLTCHNSMCGCRWQGTMSAPYISLRLSISTDTINNVQASSSHCPDLMLYAAVYIPQAAHALSLEQWACLSGQISACSLFMGHPSYMHIEVWLLFSWDFLVTQYNQ